MYNILDYGAVGDGKTLNTNAIQEAVNKCAEAGGGTVYIPADGKFISGTVHLLDNVHILFENGAILLGSKEISDFEPVEEMACLEFQDRSHSFFHQSLFYAENCDNISFSGKGLIDMQSCWQIDEGWRQARQLIAPKCAALDYDYDALLNKYDSVWYRGAKPIALKECNNVVISDLTIKNATDLAVYFAGCENVRVLGLYIESHIDGISPDSCKNVVISDCIVNVGDDAIVLKSSYTLNRLKYCENISITNCVISSRCNAIKFGTESITGFINITISNCTIYNTRFSGITLAAADGAVFDGISVNNISMRNVGNPFFIMILNRGQCPENRPIGKMRNITFSNITATGPYVEWEAIPHCYQAFIKNNVIEMPKPVPAIIVGQSDSVIENVAFTNIQITMPGGGTQEDRKIVLENIRNGYPECMCFGEKLPIYGLFARNVNNLKLCNVEFYTYERDERDAILLDKVTCFKNS